MLREDRTVSLSKEEVQRYGRHLVLPEIAMEGQKRLKEARILLIGTGGLGSPAAIYLAAAGVGTLGLIDFDVVDDSNLQRQIAHRTETFMEQSSHLPALIETEDSLSVTATLSRSVAQIVEDLQPKLIVCWSQTGSTTRLLSKTRMDVPIVAFSSDRTICRQMNLYYGVIPICREIPANIKQFTALAESIILENQWADVADRIILLPGAPLADPPASHTITLHTITPAGS